jgi:hypothetical protein
MTSTHEEWTDRMTSTYEEWTDFRLGLSFYRDGDIVYYAPCDPFYVDEIPYSMHRGNGVGHIRAMVGLVCDNGARQFTMCCSNPPTEEELDHYVKTGFLDGRRVL